MRLCSYIVKRDTGLAPNPFWEYCTLAVCTPNHMGIKLMRGDWIAGFLNKKRGNRLLYTMQISEVIHLHDYYNDSRFKKKIPNIKGGWRERCGDNFYFFDSSLKWKQHPTIFHRSKSDFEKDTKNPNVFISSHFFYFGANAVEIKEQLRGLIIERQGVKCSHSIHLVEEFLDWIDNSFKPGIHGRPIDNPDLNKKLSTTKSY
jgi:hypothetical protein